MKTIKKLMIALVLVTFTILNVKAQPKSEILDDNKPKMNWSDADTLYTFQFNAETNAWIYFQREIRRFDAKDYPIENFVQVWQKNTKTWANYLRVNYTYDENGNELEEITQQWDASFNNWINAQLRTTSYKGKQKEEILFQQWKKPTNEWYNVMKYLIKYTEKGEKNTVSISLYNGVTKSWDNHKRFVMEFDNPYAPPSLVIADTWTAGDWKTEGKYDLKYNGRGNKTLETRYTWNAGKRTWLEGIQLEMLYDRKGNQTEYVERKFDVNNNSWMNFNRSVSIFNETGNMTEKIEYVWNRTTKQWDEDGKFKFSTETKI